MASYEYPGLGSLLAIIIIGFFFINRLTNKESSIVNTTEPQDNPDPLAEPKFHLPLTMSPNAGLNAWWLRHFQQRAAHDAEFLFDLEEDGSIHVTLPLPRRVTRIEILFDSAIPVPLKSVQIGTPEGVGRPQWTGDWLPRPGGHCLQLDFDGVTPLASVRIIPGCEVRLVDCRLWLNKKGNPDAAHLEAALLAERLGHFDHMMENLLAYQELCPDNPVPALRLAHLHRHLGQNAKAEIQALRAIAAKRAEFGVVICREIADGRDWGLSEVQLANLRTEAADWDLESHHGLVTLNNERHFLSGPGAFLRERHVSAILVRRQAAARKFRSVMLPIVVGWGGMLHTAARIRRNGGTVDELSDDRFTVGSAEDDNPFIAIARRSTGIWILPDLEPGDVVEFTCDNVKLGQDRPFAVVSLGDPQCPTLHGRVTFTHPPDMDIVNAVRNSTVDFESGADKPTGWNRITLNREKIIPRRSHSDPYQLLGLNPLVAFACRADGWDELGPTLLGDYYEAVEAAKETPPRLAAAFAEAESTAARLARAFYWVRDHIKYASVASHHEVLLSPERAEFVLESGMGDCKDVSYLLALVCRDLGVPWEFVLMSTEHGILIEDLPADQFDHVILRAKIDGDWLYLDASANEAIFGAPPPLAQGLPALSGRSPYALVTLPVPTADRNRITIKQTLSSIEDGWLHGDIDVRLEGYVARYLDELWKHNSLTSVDADRAADDAVRSILPQFSIDRIERLQDTTDSDVLHLEAEGRHAPLVELDGKRIASFGFMAPGIVMDESHQRLFRERFLFPYRMSLTYELLVADDLKDALRAVSKVADLDLPMGVIREQRGDPGETVGLRREIRLPQQEIAGEDLARLPELFNRLGAATRVVVVLGD